jgi:Icc-related predicted phosphoesterase
MLMRALELTKPQMHCFGHIHEGSGTSTLKWRDGKETLLVNAAVMGGEGDPTDKPTNLAIVVELQIPRTCEA